MIFSEINARTRSFLSINDIENKWIWGSCKHVINVSQKNQETDVVRSIENHGATYIWIPMGENQDLSLEMICKAVRILLSYNGEETIVHCDGGNNRSRLVCEFATFAKTGKWLEDNLSTGLNGSPNRTAFNVKKGYLPNFSVIENAISTYLKAP